MAETNIQWAHYTFNPWRGCTKVSAGCANCYAETMSRRNHAVLGEWGPRGVRAIAAESYWKLPHRWNREAGEAGERRRVFCASLADFFEGDETMPEASREAVAQARRRTFELIDVTPHLDWLLVTKRPENIPLMWPIAYEMPSMAPKLRRMPNVWLITSVEDQPTADQRIHALFRCRELAAVLGLSCEPLLGPLDLRDYLKHPSMPDRIVSPGSVPVTYQPVVGVDWVIVGGESGPNARPCEVPWIRSIVKQCKATAVWCFVKQLGARALCGCGGDVGAWARNHGERRAECARCGMSLPLRDPKGGDPSEWPDDLRNVREFPTGGRRR